jgi:CBS-domain-containing membrane protein
MKAHDVMSRDVVTVSPDETIRHAAWLMLQRKFSGLPVVDSAGTLVGIVTEGDFLRRAETGTVRRRPRWLEFLVGPGRLAGEYTRTAGQFVKEVMTREICVVTEDAELEDVVGLMENRHIKRLPVIRGKQVVGIVTRQDLLRAFLGVAKVKAPITNDDAIRERLLAELSKQSWAPILSVVVTNGNVKLIGTIFDDRERDALRVLAENVPGVKSIEEELILIEPMSGMAIEINAAQDSKETRGADTRRKVAIEG